jgi:starch synthase (maltosyl-transferring)
MDKPVMTPAPGERILRFVGDVVQFQLRGADQVLPQNGRAILRTNLGKAVTLRKEIISTYSGKRPLSIAFWRDIPMQRQPDGSWLLELPVTEPGYFKAKAYFVDAFGRQLWPDGPDLGICCHPSDYRTGNTIYCAFPRMFNSTKTDRTTRDAVLEKKMKDLDEQGFTVIPPSGKMRDLQRELPHIMGRLGCKILHLLPLNPTPTTMAKYGRFGSPYACQDLLAIDPSLVDFDKKTNGVEQFRELAYDIHQRGGRVFLDVVINHTGWGSTLLENHPEWFLREHDGKFASPGAWGTVWEDLVELNPHFTELWEHFADAFLEWCRRGVDGFRCDAGYKVPMPVWQYIEARVRQEFPDTVFLLEGLGGSWEATENLLTEGGMQWAYSELFQNYSGGEVQWYLDYALRQSERVGVYVHYSETHDNDRLAKKGKQWSLLRNRLCALTSVSGGFGFTCGVEWLADEKIEVHQSRGLNWGSRHNIVPELARLNQLLTEHPCFFDSAKLTRLSPNASPVYALHRVSATGEDSVLVLVNTDVNAAKEFSLSEAVFKELGEPLLDLLGQTALKPSRTEGRVAFNLSTGAAYCLASTAKPRGLSGDAYKRARAQASWALSALSKVLMPEYIGNLDWRELAKLVDDDPKKFLGAVSDLQSDTSISLDNFRSAGKIYPQVVNWTLLDRRRITPVPPAHWLLISDDVPFRAALKVCHEERQRHVESIPAKNGHVAFFPPRNDENAGDAELRIERYATDDQQVEASIRFLSAVPAFSPVLSRNEQVPDDAMVLLTNGIGGMSRLCVDLGKIKSKYDCALGASLHPTLPVDRHVLAKRVRVWVNADGFITALNLQNLSSFEAGPPAVWKFVANAGDERTVEIFLHADMLEGRNTTVFKFSLAKGSAVGFSAAEKRKLDIRLTVRVDIEDRNFHSETHRNSGAEHHFGTNCHPLDDKSGFLFAPAYDRTLRVYSSSGFYHHQPEWSENIPHPVEQSRAQVGSGDAYSPGWFDLPLKGSEEVALVLSADANEPSSDLIHRADENRIMETTRTVARAKLPEDDSFGRQLALAARQYVVRRGSGKTVIAGYPWFLDWGRDTMIAARGLLSAGMIADVTELLLTFGRFVENGTMPNTIHGENASNRNTSDASLWYGVVAEEAAQMNPGLYSLAVDGRGRTVSDVLREIGAGYLRGTPNGIHVDGKSGLVWSPGHFTWMDTNYPPGSPREGYPIEIQALWIRLLRQLDRLHAQPESERWSDLADRAEKSLHDLYWLEDKGYFSDLLIAESGIPAKNSVVEDALRSNCLLVISLGLVTGERARRCVDAAVRYLFVPGALRSLAPLPVSPPLRVEWHGRLLNDPERPYFGQYCGDEDTQRKPAYHNGTAWTWTFPTACEALAIAWEFSPESVAAAKAYLGSMEKLMQNGSLGQLPEILDGDAPHFQRGCDAQAWSVTEALRVWKLLQRIS